MADEKPLSTENEPQLVGGGDLEKSSAPNSGIPAEGDAGNAHHTHFGANQVYDDPSGDLPEVEKVESEDKIEITEEMCYEELGFAFPEWKKW